MIYGKPTKYGSGIEICGDYNDFRELHEFIYRFSNIDKLPFKFEEYLLGFAYDVRKAYEGFREIKDAGHPLADQEFEKLKYLNFRRLWIDKLLTVRLLRWSAAYFTTTLLDQSLLYRLEHVTFESLEKFDAKNAPVIWQFINYLDIFTEDYPIALIELISNRFQDQQNGKARFNSILPLLKSLSPYSEIYKDNLEQLKKSAEQYKCSLDSLTFQDNENKSFKW